MMLWEEGRFQLRDPVSKYLPEFADMKVALPVEPGDYRRGPFKTVSAMQPITVQHLLTHTAGLPNPYRGGHAVALRSGSRQPQTRRHGRRLRVGPVQAPAQLRARLPLGIRPGDRRGGTLGRGALRDDLGRVPCARGSSSRSAWRTPTSTCAVQGSAPRGTLRARRERKDPAARDAGREQPLGAGAACLLQRGRGPGLDDCGLLPLPPDDAQRW